MTFAILVCSHCENCTPIFLSSNTHVHFLFKEMIRSRVVYLYCSRIRIVIYLQKLCEFTLCSQVKAVSGISMLIIELEKAAKECSSLWNSRWVEPSPALARSHIVVNVERKTRPLLKRAPTPDYRPRRDWIFVRNKWPLMVFLVGVSADNARSMARLALNPRKQRVASRNTLAPLSR